MRNILSIWRYLLGLLSVRPDGESPHRPQAPSMREGGQEYFAWLAQAGQHPPCVADALWRDLNAQDVFLRINSATQTLCGEQVLYARMRTYLADLAATRQAQQAYPANANAEADNATRRALAALAKQPVSLVGPLFAGAPRLPGHIGLYGVMSLLPGLALLAAIYLPLFAHITFPLACLALCANLAVRAKLWDRVEQWAAYFEGLHHLLSAASALGTLPDSPTPGAQEVLRRSLPPCRRLQSACRLFAQQTRWQNDLVQSVLGFANWLLLADILLIQRTHTHLPPNRQALQDLFLAVGHLDADCAIRHYLRQAGSHCLPSFHSGQPLDLQGSYHPLLTPATASHITLNANGMVIMGENGAGKTTLMRTLGINVLLARTLGFCHARSATLPFATLASSIHIQDDLRAGISYFIAELQRAKVLDSLTHSGQAALLLIDEPMRGTNAIESLAIAAALLRDWAHRAHVVVTTHDAMLAQALQAHYEIWHITRHPQGEAAAFALQPGMGSKTNAIDCLQSQGFADAICHEAKRISAALSDAQQHHAKALAI